MSLAPFGLTYARSVSEPARFELESQAKLKRPDKSGLFSLVGETSTYSNFSQDFWNYLEAIWKAAEFSHAVQVITDIKPLPDLIKIRL